MIPLFKVFMSEESKQNALDVLSSGFIGQGTKVDEFENELKNIFYNDCIATTNSATSAEHLALHLLKNKDGSQSAGKIFEKFRIGSFHWLGAFDGNKFAGIHWHSQNWHANDFESENEACMLDKCFSK